LSACSISLSQSALGFVSGGTNSRHFLPALFNAQACPAGATGMTGCRTQFSGRHLRNASFAAASSVFLLSSAYALQHGTFDRSRDSFRLCLGARVPKGQQHVDVQRVAILSRKNKLT
jgi:hypothetical protein